jgi:hypothetical protein
MIFIKEYLVLVLACSHSTILLTLTLTLILPYLFLTPPTSIFLLFARYFFTLMHFALFLLFSIFYLTPVPNKSREFLVQHSSHRRPMKIFSRGLFAPSVSCSLPESTMLYKVYSTLKYDAPLLARCASPPPIFHGTTYDYSFLPSTSSTHMCVSSIVCTPSNHVYHVFPLSSILFSGCIFLSKAFSLLKNPPFSYLCLL